MIYCVWYPSGGFGHFINAVLTLYGDNFVRPKQKLQFSPVGDSHNLDLVAPKYFLESWPGGIEFLKDKNYCVLVDNGINNESDKFKSTFPGATVIRICYSDHTWPIVARTTIAKAQRKTLEKKLATTEWGTDEPWARREKYFLYLRDHSLRNAWKPTTDPTLFVEDMLSYNRLFDKLNLFVGVEPFDQVWTNWRQANAAYIDPVETAQNVMNLLDQKQSADLTHITDVWTQSVIYYYIWLEFEIEVPHNDFANFFNNTDQIMELVR